MSTTATSNNTTEIIFSAEYDEHLRSVLKNKEFDQASSNLFLRNFRCYCDLICGNENKRNEKVPEWAILMEYGDEYKEYIRNKYGSNDVVTLAKQIENTNLFDGPIKNIRAFMDLDKDLKEVCVDLYDVWSDKLNNLLEERDNKDYMKYYKKVYTELQPILKESLTKTNIIKVLDRYSSDKNLEPDSVLYYMSTKDFIFYTVSTTMSKELANRFDIYGKPLLPNID